MANAENFPLRTRSANSDRGQHSEGASVDPSRFRLDAETPGIQGGNRKMEANKDDTKEVAFCLLIMRATENITNVKLVYMALGHTKKERLLDQQTIKRKFTRDGKEHTYVKAEGTLRLSAYKKYQYYFTISINGTELSTESDHVVLPGVQRKVHTGAELGCRHGYLVHLDDILRGIENMGTFEDIIKEVKRINFSSIYRSIDGQAEVLYWVDRMDIGKLSPPQVLFLLTVLEMLWEASEKESILFDFDSDQINRLLQYIHCADISPKDIPQSVSKLLKEVFIWLTNKINGGLVHFFVYFSPVMEVSTILDVKDKLCTRITPDVWDTHGNRFFHSLRQCSERQQRDVLFVLIDSCNSLKILAYFAKSFLSKDYKMTFEAEVIEAVLRSMTRLLPKSGHERTETLYGIWQDQVLIQSSRLASFVRKHLIENIKAEPWPNAYSPTDMAVFILKESDSDADRAYIFTNLLKPWHCAQSNITLLQAMSTKDVTNRFGSDVIESLLEDGLQKLTRSLNFGKQHKSNESSRRNCLKQYYKLLAVIRTLDSPRVLPFYEDLVYMNIKVMPPEELVGNVCDNRYASYLNDAERQCLADHIQQRVQQEDLTMNQKDSMICRLKDSSFHGLIISNDTILQLVTSILETIDETVTVVEVVEHYEFWRLIFTCTGKYSKLIFKNKIVKNISTMLCNLMISLRENNLPLNHPVWNILQCKPKVNHLADLTMIVPGHRKGDHASVMKHIQNQLNMKNTYVKERDQLAAFHKHTIDLLSRFLAEEDKQEIEICLMQPDGNLIMNRESIDQYWGPNIQRILSMASCVEKQLKSRMYINICFAILENNGARDDMNISTMEFCKLLESDCTEVFNLQCDEILSGRLHLHTSELAVLLHGICTSVELEDELKLLEEIANNDERHQRIFDALRCFINREDLKQKAHLAVEVFKHINEEAVTDANEILSAFYADNLALDDWMDSIRPLLDLEDILNGVAGIGGQPLSKTYWRIFEQMSKSYGLIKFLKEVIDEDLRNLIDVVGNHSDIWIELMDVKQYITPFLKNEYESQVDVYKSLLVVPTGLNISDIPTLMSNCSKHLQLLLELYRSMATRSTITLDVISAALSDGNFCFTWDELLDQCKVSLTYPKKSLSENSYGECTMEELTELRSRALLIITSAPKGHLSESLFSGSEEPPDLPLFVECINSACAITDLYAKVKATGFSELELRTLVPIFDLHKFEDELKEELMTWKCILDEARSRFFYINFFTGKQLRLLERYFLGLIDMREDLKLSEEVKLLFHFVYPYFEITPGLVATYTRPSINADLRTRLQRIATALDTVFREKSKCMRRISIRHVSSNKTIHSTVQPGEIFIAHLPEDSARCLHVVMQLCLNTTGFYPEPSEILFCQNETSIEEIDLILKRCSFAESSCLNRLYLIVNVELLSTEIQLFFVDKIKQIQQEKNRNLRLAVVCREKRTHHIFRQFPPRLTHQLFGISEEALGACLKADFPQVEIVNSTYAGLGKSFYIMTEASALSSTPTEVLPVLVGGPVSKKDLVKCLRREEDNFSILYLNVKEMENTSILDEFIFELVIVGMVSAGEHACRCMYKRVFIEIANSLNEHLKTSLVICRLFHNTFLQWNDFRNYVIPSNLASSEQIVCRYKKALDNKVIDTENIGLDRGTPVTENECRSILRMLFKDEKSLSFVKVKNLVNILAEDLRKLSKSTFFLTSNLEYAMGKKMSKLTIRSDMVQTFFAIANEITSRLSSPSPPPPARHSLSATSRYQRLLTASSMVDRYHGIAKWSEGNHLLTVFNRQDTATVTVLYKQKSLISEAVKRLLQIQGEKLIDYSTMSQEDLKTILERVCKRRTRSLEVMLSLPELQDRYVLTHDNILKMVLIMVQIEARIPVIIMGETGCGKTMLITYLARLSEVCLRVIHLHAGTTEKDIISFVQGSVDESKRRMTKDSDGEEQLPKYEIEEVWLFFDEINTCAHMGLLAEIICYNQLNGKPLPQNMVCIAACNPYCFRNSTPQDVGLQGRMKHEEKGKLVYRVEPLPETMLNYVWDFGWLDERDERAYIKRMVEDTVTPELEQLLIDLLILSQDFIRKIEGTRYSVSLRDINRCKNLVQWMANDFLKKKGIAKLCSEKDEIPGCKGTEFRGVLLALSLCYHSRLIEVEKRKAYRVVIANRCRQNGREIDEVYIRDVIKAEQEDILDRMHLPAGTAKNEAIRENVFVILVAILIQFPVFVVGKPGSSKSLSMHLIEANLRGTESNDNFFKKLPAVFKLSFQGSQSSTSDGIKRVFEKAFKYKREDRQPVVLLDEIGLAEDSKYNPLKVLHELLDPDESGYPSVAVVGLSNWTIDAAKMNRAIHLSRPDPSIEDLYATATAIRDGLRKSGNEIVSNNNLRQLSKAYFEYKHQEQHKNFHGLRDFYSLVRYLTMQTCITGICDKAILRNFGGLPRQETAHVLNTLTEKAGIMQQIEKRPTIVELIEENLSDVSARHLMLITKGSSDLSVLQETLHGRPHILLLGSGYQNDLTEEYDHRILSKIVLHMEMECILVLWGLESIYGCLYDMLNQNYKKLGGKMFCRIAIGPNCNISREVHPKFKCIVLVDENSVHHHDPPFLSRFEKQAVSFSDVLNDSQKQIVADLRRWIDDIAFIQNLQSTAEESFVGYHEGTLPSIVLRNSSVNECSWSPTHSGEISPYESELIPGSFLFTRCIGDLLNMACSDAVLRFSNSALRAAEDYKPGFTPRSKQVPVPYQPYSKISVSSVQKHYFTLPLQQGIKHFMQSILASETNLPFIGSKIRPQRDGEGLKLVIHTFSSIHADVRRCLQGTATYSGPLDVQVEKLSSYNCERHLEIQFQHFWTMSNSRMLVIQCKAALDTPHMLMVRCLNERYRSEYLVSRKRRIVGAKHIVIVIHLDRGTGEGKEQQTCTFDFLNDWHIFTLETLEVHEYAKTDLTRVPILDVIIASTAIEDVTKEQLLWCFTCINYTSGQRQVDAIFHLIRIVAESKVLIKNITEYILQMIRDRASTRSFDNWEMEIACNRQLLVECSTMAEARKETIKKHIREEMAKIVYTIEKLFAWDSIMLALDESVNPTSELDERVRFWIHCFKSSHIFEHKFTEISSPMGVNSFIIDKPLLDLKFPYSLIFHEKIQRKRDWMMKHLQTETKSQDEPKVVLDVCNRLADVMNNEVPDLLHKDYLAHFFLEYIDDFCNMLSSNYAPNCDAPVRVNITKWLIQCQGPQREENVGEEHQKNILQSLATWYVAYWSVERELPAQIKLVVAFVESSQFCLEKLQNEVTPNIRPDRTAVSSATVFGNEPSAPVSLEGEEICSNVKMSYRLVSTICKSIMPTKRFVNSCGGILPWRNYASQIINLATDVNDDSYFLHFLMICFDFQQLLTVAGQDQYEPLENIAVIGSKDEHAIERQDVFKEIREILHTLELQESIPEDHANNFLCLYIGRCIEASTETPLLDEFLSTLVTSSGNLVSGARLVLYTAILWEISSVETLPAVMSTWRNFLHANLREMPTLTCIDSQLQLQRNLDCPLAVACCRVLEEFLQDFILPKDVGSIDIGDIVPEIITILKSSEICSLQLVAAVAFTRAVFKAFSAKFEDGIAPDLTEKPLSDLKGHINTLIHEVSADQDSIHSLLLFLLRCLHRRFSEYYHFVTNCRELSAFLPSLECVNCSGCFYQNRLAFDPMLYVPHYEDAEQWIANHIIDHSGMAKLNNPEYRLALFAVIIHKGYLPRSLGNNDVLDPKLKEYISNNTKSFPQDAYEFLNRLLSVNVTQVGSRTSGKTLQPEWLQLSEESTPRDVAQASVVIHLCAAVFSYFRNGQPNAFGQYFGLSTPDHLQNLFVPASGEAKPLGFIPEGTGIRIITYDCICGLVLLQAIKPLSLCPGCGRVCKKDDWKPVEGTFSENESVPGYHIEEYNNSRHYIYGIRGLSPVPYRVVRLIFHSFLLISCTIKQSIMQAMMQVFHTTENGVLSDLTRRIRIDWNILEDLLDLHYEDVCLLLHAIVQEVREILSSEKYSAHRTDGRNQLERKLASIIERQVQLIPANIQHFRKLSTKPHSCIMFDIEEIATEERSLNGASSTKDFQDLFCYRKEASFKDFRANFLSQDKSFFEKHAFLALFLRWCEPLVYVKYLPILIEWNSKLSSFLCHRINRQTAANMAHGVLFDTPLFQPDEQKRKELKNVYTDFQKAWNKIRDGWEHITGTSEELEPMVERKPIILSLFYRDQVNDQLWRMITTLQAVQNRFLQEVSTLATDDPSSCLQFLTTRGAITIPHVLLKEVKDQDVIHFDIDDICLDFHDLATSPQKGTYNRYDFAQIENKLVKCVVRHKTMLRCPSETAFENFVFADELFHACSVILKEVSDKVPQEKLPNEVVKSLQQQQVQNKTFAREMLEQLEILLGLLKRTGGHPDDLLNDFVQNWYSRLPQKLASDLIPEPRSAIKVKHVVDLYQTIETFLFEDAVQSLQKLYSDKIPEHLQGKMQTKCSNASVENLEIVRTTIKRFIFRYLRSGNNINPRECIVEALTSRKWMPTMTDKERNVVTALIDEEMEVSNIRKILDEVENEIKKYNIAVPTRRKPVGRRLRIR